MMRKLKEAVKAGEIQASEALTALLDEAYLNETLEHFTSTHTYRWLLRRAQQENN